MLNHSYEKLTPWKAYKSIKKYRLFYWIWFDLKISVHCHYNPFCHSTREKKETTEAHFDGLHSRYKWTKWFFTVHGVFAARILMQCVCVRHIQFSAHIQFIQTVCTPAEILTIHIHWWALNQHWKGKFIFRFALNFAVFSFRKCWANQKFSDF